MRILNLIVLSIGIFSQGMSQDWQWQNPLPQGNDLQCVRFVDANTGYAVGKIGTIIKTTDGGATWDILNSGTTLDLNSVFFTGFNTGYVVGGDYFSNILLKTIDGGESWTSQSLGIDMLFLNSVFFINESTGWIAGRVAYSQDGCVIFRTSDGGNTWTRQTFGPNSGLSSVFFVNENLGYAVGSTFAKTTDGGIHWTDLNNASGSSLFFTDENTGYIAGGYGQICKTNDGGMTWTILTTDSTYYLNSIQFTSSNTGYAVGGNWADGVIMRTADGGVSWENVSFTGSSNILSVHFPDAYTGFAVGWFGSTVKTVDAGAGWYVLSSQVSANNLNSVHFSDLNTGYAVGDSGTILKTTNGGMMWVNQNSGTSQTLSSVYFTSVNTGYAAGDSGTILKTMDGGATWIQQASGIIASFSSIHFPTPDTGYVVGGGDIFGTQGYGYVILKTLNGGANWFITKLDTTTFGMLHSVFFTDASSGYAVGSRIMGGTLGLKTTDGGQTWTSGPGGTRVQFPDASTGYITGIEYASNSNHLLKTTDGGITWSTIHLNSFYATSVFFPDPDTGFVAGLEGSLSHGAIIRTTDGGNTWSTPLFITANEFNSIYFANSETGYAVGSHGTIVKTVTGGGIPIGIHEKSSVRTDLKIYPCPATDRITIETHAASKENHFTLYNSRGIEVINQFCSENKTDVDVSRLKPGLYFVKVTFNSGIQIGKFIKY